MTNDGKVLEHLLKYGTITSLEAIEKYKITRLSASIFNLRNKGYTIGTLDEHVLIDGKERNFARYVIKNGRG